ncbi:hypothetical protein [Tannockella kyphosi]|uniref:hypothetical protein n=1 Tax=Tannockella kyphosi TaxID=2899121 RepID=UPI00201267CB|nr:hypothetical protein [Tannockella kyphosi]
MKNKTKKIFAISTVIALLGVIVYFIVANPLVSINNQKLENSIKSIETEAIQLNDIVPFEWDIMYTFSPYASQDEIEQIIGFESADVKENNISEGMVHLLFVKDDKVVASVLGYSSNLGYSIDFTEKITYAENAQFSVINSDDVITLSYTK